MSRRKGILLPATQAGVSSLLPAGYDRLLAEIKSRVRTAQLRAVHAANRELVQLYWDIGHLILDRQQQEGWGAKVIHRLATDLKRAFPEMQGFSPRNLKYMRAFAAAYPGREIVQAPLAQITWYHHITLLEKVPDPAERRWYAAKAVDNGWSRDVMALQIESGLFQRQGQAITNFARTLPPPQSDLAAQTLKDPYVFDFLTLTEAAREREIEDALRGLTKPIGISQYELTRALPADLKPSLPTVEEIEAELARDLKRTTGMNKKPTRRKTTSNPRRDSHRRYQP
jgi:predicted nuclease of restriction endonuclease-like (RecB) superfamily